MSVPAFIDLDTSEQVKELREHLHSKGGDISVEPSDSILQDILDLVKAANSCWASLQDTEVESIFNSIISLILIIPSGGRQPLIQAVCDTVGSSVADEKSSLSHCRMRLLSNLFNGLDERDTMRYHLYLPLVKMAGKTDNVYLVDREVSEVKKWVSQWSITTQQVQDLLRALHESYLQGKYSEKATKVMIELLGTYTEDTASQARDDAHRCIVTCLADPNTYLMDHLLTLKPVKFLEGELIHDLLTIFVSKKLSDYTDFHNRNKDFVGSIGLSHEQNMQKMRTLTFMQMSEGKSEIEFAVIQREMNLDEDEVEQFIMDVVRSKTVMARMDHMARKVMITSTTHRTFGRHQWQMVREDLVRWQGQLNQVMQSLGVVVRP